MAWTLRIVLIAASLLMNMYIVQKIRKSQMKIEHSIFWILFAVLLLILSFFPQIAYAMAVWIGIEAPSNFIYLLMIFLLIIKVFLMSVRQSQLEYRMSVMAEEVAIWQKNTEEQVIRVMGAGQSGEKEKGYAGMQEDRGCDSAGAAG